MTSQVFNEFSQKQHLLKTLDGLDASTSSHNRDNALDHMNRVGSDGLTIIRVCVRLTATAVSGRGRASWRKGFWFSLEPTTETHFEHPTTGDQTCPTDTASAVA